jgi:hypothetical protein
MQRPVSDSALASRLDRIERRQTYVLALLAYPYLLGGLWLFTNDAELRAVLLALLPAVGIALVAYLVALFRARTDAVQ